jgi:hypothetical protein
MISVTRPIGEAWDWMKGVLFQPFDVGKWFVLGFTAFLAGLGEGGGGPSCNFPSGGGGSGRGGGGGGGGPDLAAAESFVREHLLVILLVAAAILLFVFGIWALVAWLSCRGRFMFLDNVVNNRCEVKAPWRRFRYLADSLFLFRLVLGLGAGVLMLAVLVLGGVVALPDIQARQFGPRAIAAIAGAGGFFLVFALVYGVFMAVVKDFAVPVMYVRNLRPMDALAVFRRELLPGNLGSFVLFYLMKIVLGIAAGFVVLIGTCATCCIASLPYLSSVAFLPVTVFFQAYTLRFLEQFGPNWRILPACVEPPPPPRPAWNPYAQPPASPAGYWDGAPPRQPPGAPPTAFPPVEPPR